MKLDKDHAVYQALRENHVIEAKPRLIAEWNMNRYVGATIDNDPKEYDEAYEPEHFPIETLIKTNRPDRGIVKARLGESRAGYEFVDTKVQQFRRKKEGGIWTNIPRTNKNGDYVYKTYTRPLNAPRYYVSSPEDHYQYWTSPTQSLGTESASGGYEFPVGYGVHITIDYASKIRTNKISLCAESTWSAPQRWRLQVSRSNDASGNPIWTTIATDADDNFKVDANGAAPIGDDGRLNFFYNGTTWAPYSAEHRRQARDLQNPVDEINAIRFHVDAMSRPRSHLNLIEISPRMEKDLTDYLTSVSDDFEMSEHSFLTPIGKASSNTGNVELFNPLVSDAVKLTVDEKHSVTSDRGLLFNNENPNSLFYGLLDANVKMTLHYRYEVSGSTYDIPQFEMFSGNWSGQTQQNVSVSLDDYSKYMMEIYPPKGMYLDLTVAEIIWRICDSIGFTKYEIERMDTEFPRTIPVFWIDGEKTVWEIFTELTEGTQVAVYFDGTGTLKIKTKDAAFDADKDGDSVWTVRGENGSSDNYSNEIADIVDLDKTNEYSANHVTVNYYETKFSEFNNGFPAMETVWEPGQEDDISSKEDKKENGTFDDAPAQTVGDTLVLRSTPLKKSLLKNSTFFTIQPDQAKHWPYQGIVQIQGELIRYTGKEYIWYDNGNVRNSTVINNSDEFKEIENKSGKNVKHKNHFNGNMKIHERGLWNTENKRHPVEAEGYRVHAYMNGNKRENGKGFRHYKSQSIVQLRAPRKRTGKDWRFAMRGSVDNAGFYFMGTKLRLPKDNGTDAFAGITFHQNGTEDNGYFVEIRPTKKMTAATRKKTHEMYFYSKKGTTTKRFGPDKGKGRAVFIALDVWYEIDIQIEKDAGDHHITINLNGQQVMKVTVPNSSEWNQPWTGKFGMYVRGHSTAQWEYLYALSRPVKPVLDNLSFMDKVESAYVGRQWEREWVWRNRTSSRRKKKPSRKERDKFSQMFYDEFGPYAHEVREFDVNFDPAPVLHSRLYVSNDWEVVCPEYRSHAFGAQFILANAARKNAVLQGDDSSLGTDNIVSQHTFIVGRNVVVGDAETIIVKDEGSIRRRGKIEVVVDSPWVQSKSHGLNIAEWIRDHWGKPADQLTVEIFGNPLIEVTDVVTVSYLLHDFNITNYQYFVTATSNSFSDGGISTNLTLRRAHKLT